MTTLKIIRLHYIKSLQRETRLLLVSRLTETTQQQCKYKKEKIEHFTAHNKLTITKQIQVMTGRATIIYDTHRTPSVFSNVYLCVLYR